MRRSKTLRVSDVLHCPSDNENELDAFSFGNNRTYGGDVKKDYLVQHEDAEGDDVLVGVGMNFEPAPAFAPKAREEGRVRAQKRKIRSENSSDESDVEVKPPRGISVAIPSVGIEEDSSSSTSRNNAPVNTITKQKQRKQKQRGKMDGIVHISGEDEKKRYVVGIDRDTTSVNSSITPVSSSSKPRRTTKTSCKKKKITTEEIFTDSEEEKAATLPSLSIKPAKPAKTLMRSRNRQKFVFHDRCIPQCHIVQGLDVTLHSPDQYGYNYRNEACVPVYDHLRSASCLLRKLVPIIALPQSSTAHDVHYNDTDDASDENSVENSTKMIECTDDPIECTPQIDHAVRTDAIDWNLTMNSGLSITDPVLLNANSTTTLTLPSPDNYTALLRSIYHRIVPMIRYKYTITNYTHTRLITTSFRMYAKILHTEIIRVLHVVFNSVVAKSPKLQLSSGVVEDIDDNDMTDMHAIVEHKDIVEHKNIVEDKDIVEDNDSVAVFNIYQSPPTKQEPRSSLPTISPATNTDLINPNAHLTPKVVRVTTSNDAIISVIDNMLMTNSPLFADLASSAEDEDASINDSANESVYTEIKQNASEYKMKDIVMQLSVDDELHDDDNYDNNNTSNVITSPQAKITTSTLTPSIPDDANVHSILDNNVMSCIWDDIDDSGEDSDYGQNNNNLDNDIALDVEDTGYIVISNEEISGCNVTVYEPHNIPVDVDQLISEDDSSSELDLDLDAVCCETVDTVISLNSATDTAMCSLYCGLTSKQVQLIEHIDLTTFPYLASACVSLASISAGGGKLRGNVKESACVMIKNRVVEAYHAALSEFECDSAGTNPTGWAQTSFFHLDHPFLTHNDVVNIQSHMADFSTALLKPQYHQSVEQKAMAMVRRHTRLQDLGGQCPGQQVLHSVSKTELQAVLAGLLQLVASSNGANNDVDDDDNHKDCDDMEFMHVVYSTIYVLQYLQFAHNTQQAVQLGTVMPELSITVASHNQVGDRHSSLETLRHTLQDSAQGMLEYLSIHSSQAIDEVSIELDEDGQVSITNGGCSGALAFFVASVLFIASINSSDIPSMCIALRSETELELVFRIINLQCESLNIDPKSVLSRWSMEDTACGATTVPPILLVHTEELAMLPTDALSERTLLYTEAPECFVRASACSVRAEPHISRHQSTNNELSTKDLVHFDFATFLQFVGQNGHVVAVDHTAQIEKRMSLSEFAAYNILTQPCSYDLYCLLGVAAENIIGPCMFSPHMVLHEDILLNSVACVVIIPLSQSQPQLTARIRSAKQHFDRVYCILLDDQTAAMPLFTRLGIYHAADNTPRCHELTQNNYNDGNKDGAQQNDSWPGDEQIPSTYSTDNNASLNSRIILQGLNVQGFECHGLHELPATLYTILEAERKEFGFEDVIQWQKHVASISALQHPLFGPAYNIPAKIHNMAGKTMSELLETRPALSQPRQKTLHSQMLRKNNKTSL